jgi:hypothetical protein
MDDRIEKIIKIVYNKWKFRQLGTTGPHPDEEALACFIKGKLGYEENEQVKIHLLGCEDCMEKIALQIKLEPDRETIVPQEFLTQAKNLVKRNNAGILEIIFKLKGNILELVNTTGDILVGQELVPLPVLRSRRIKDFKDEVVILKDIKDIRVELKIENKHGKSFNLTVIAREKPTQKVIKDLRITLLKDDLELESYHTDSGRVIFENILLGKYMVEISDVGNKLASVIIDIKT